jgi:hypothetical protein
MSASPDERIAAPAMPMEWTPSLVRQLFPLKIGRGLELEMLRPDDSSQVLHVFDSSGRGRGARYPDTAAGWTAAWDQIGEWTSPARLGRAAQSWTARIHQARVPVRQPAVTIGLDAQMPPVLSGLTFLGGHGQGEGLTAGAGADLRRASSGIALTSPADGALLLNIPARQLIGAEASGPDSRSVGPYVAAVGGTGLPNMLALEQIRRLNERHSTDWIRTQVRIQGTACELFFSSGSYAPDAAQVALSAVRALAPAPPAQATAPADPMAGLAHVPGPVPAGGEPGPDADLVTKLERLARLRESGALSEFEFQSAKDRLLN